MEAGEIAGRLLRRHWLLITICLILPVLSTALLVLRQPAQYTADARIITGSAVPSSSTVADATASQVQGLATGRGAVAHALRSANAKRNVEQFASNNVSVIGLGGSQVVDLVVTDRNPVVATKVAAALASEVTASLNDVGQNGLTTALQAISRQVAQLTTQRALLAARAAARPGDQQLQAKLAGLDQVIANFTSDRSRLLTEAGAQSHAMIVDSPVPPTSPQPRGLVQKLGLALLLGLVAGVLIAAIAETARPTVPGPRQVSVRLGAPMLGHIAAPDKHADGMPELAELSQRLRLASARAGVSTLALASLAAGVELDELATALQRALPDGVGHQAHTTGMSNGTGASARAGGTVLLPGTQHRDDQSTREQQALRIRPLTHLAAERDLTVGSVGLLILTGRATRAADVEALSDLAAACGWPVLGVVGVGGRPAWRPPSVLPPSRPAAHQPSGPSPSPAGADRRTADQRR